MERTLLSFTQRLFWWILKHNDFTSSCYISMRPREVQLLWFTVCSHIFLYFPQTTGDEAAPRSGTQAALHWCFRNAWVCLWWKQPKCKVFTHFHFQAWARGAKVHNWGSKGDLSHEAGSTGSTDGKFHTKVHVNASVNFEILRWKSLWQWFNEQKQWMPWPDFHYLTDYVGSNNCVDVIRLKFLMDQN